MRFAAAAALIALVVSAAVPPGTANATTPPSTAGWQPPQKHQTVTLITGDRVTLRADGNQSVEPGPGRRGITFSTQNSRGKRLVIPSDVRPLIAAGRLDRRLFDAAGLAAAGYDDARSPQTPLLITYAGRTRAALPSGAKIAREFPVINGAAVKLPKTTGLTANSGIDKIWLDGVRQPTLDRSVPQIGAPAAWQAGYSGKGVSVAVLDSGIDSTHPDLAGQVAQRKNFTTEPDGDQTGHGTHVASTIAGTGAASQGKYRGVASGATLYDGKVCARNGCPDSAILAGLEWAATEVKAKVVNLSLGAEDLPGIDPVEAAVNRLTAQTGTLFVIAAGNAGPGAGTVSSPGSADAALTVGAVDKENQLADLSGRGPRAGDGAIKPDVTAPGIDIVAARAHGVPGEASIAGAPAEAPGAGAPAEAPGAGAAAEAPGAGALAEAPGVGTPAGTSADEHYLAASGTSMATPHVAGAAALLAQQHPAWKAAELKASLVASAEPHGDQTAMEQGAGRIDVARAITQTVVADPVSLGFGAVQWPHTDDTPITRTATYRNLGDSPVTLAIAGQLTGPDGEPAPAGALKLSATTLTVPARGTATVQATVDTRHTGPDGLYSGQIVAISNQIRIVTALAVDKEVESHTLTVRTIGPDGELATDAYATLLDFAAGQVRDLPGNAQLRLPKGEYAVDAGLVTPHAEGPGDDAYDVTGPVAVLDRDVTVTFDLRKTREVKVTAAAQPGARAGLMLLAHDRRSADGQVWFNFGMMVDPEDRLFSAQQGPDEVPERFTGSLMAFLSKPAADGSSTNTPYQYAVADLRPGAFYTGLRRVLRDRDLATVHQQINATSEREITRSLLVSLPGVYISASPLTRFATPATTRVLFEPGYDWERQLSELNADRQEITQSAEETVRYAAGTVHRERWNAAALVPLPAIAERAGGDLVIGIYPQADADGHGWFTATPDSASSKLYRDGKLLSELPDFGYAEVSDVPAEPAAYRFETSMTRSVSWLSTRTDLVATFRSAGGEQEQFPIRTVRYLPDVDARNTVRRSPVTVLPVRLQGAPGVRLPAVRELSVQVSGDAGKTWRPARVVRVGADEYRAVFPTPAGPSVALRARTVDAAGNSTDQTVIGAWMIR
ncbi:S8 family serine peptidase [Kribbella sp. NPDC051770]|uniref:S8 family serine peptidase n=1 Tax=Kribbella sp. NPDC051770 TaxID=3155413 RepID=UPI0034237386